MFGKFEEPTIHIMAGKLNKQKGTLECTVTKLNVRDGNPSTSAPIVGSLKKGQQVSYIGYVNDGTSVRGISKWYKDNNDRYYWSGGVKATPIPTNSSDLSRKKSLSAAVGSGCTNDKADVTLVQSLLKAKGVSITVDGIFGPNTKKAIINFQKGALGFRNGDGRLDVGGKTWKGLNDPTVNYTKPIDTSDDDFNTKYKDVIIQGSVFPDKPIVTNKTIHFNAEIKDEYIPAMERALADSSKGMKLLCTIMAFHEGFKKGSRSYRTNNPGNIGNTDAGSNVAIKSLEDGIRRQRDYINRIVEGKNSAYPMGKKKIIKPYYSPEIAKNPQYGLPAWLPGYEFVFTGQLDQFVKIYSTGARAGNSYLSTILSYLIANGMNVNAQSKIGDIVK